MTPQGKHISEPTDYLKINDLDLPLCDILLERTPPHRDLYSHKIRKKQDPKQKLFEVLLSCHATFICVVQGFLIAPSNSLATL